MLKDRDTEKYTAKKETKKYERQEYTGTKRKPEKNTFWHGTKKGLA